MGVAYIFYNTGIRRRTDMKVGFIGGGNMASAMIGGMIQKGVVSADDILVSVRTEKSVERLTNQFGVQATMENEAVVAGSDLVFLAVKPNQIKTSSKTSSHPRRLSYRFFPVSLYNGWVQKSENQQS